MILVGERNFATEYVSETELRIAVNPMDSGLYNVTVSNPSAQKHTLYEALQVGSLTDSGELAESCEDVTLYFELNKDSLTTESEQSVLAQSDCWMNSNVQLRLKGIVMKGEPLNTTLRSVNDVLMPQHVFERRGLLAQS